MKVTKAHYKTLEAAILARIKKHPSIAGYKEHDLSPTRYAYDLLYGVTLIEGVSPSHWICDNVYPYADDTHLKTALMSISRLNVTGFADWEKNHE